MSLGHRAQVKRNVVVLTSRSPRDVGRVPAHIDDPLGGLLTNEELSRRDSMVFEFCCRHKIPVAWNLAGGYQRAADGSIDKVIEIHRETMRQCKRVFAP